jgi:hypothetical protein
MSGCRVCGAPLVPGAPASVHGCDACGGSPACARCGHPRREHKGAFGGSRENGCTTVVLVPGTTTVAECGCPEYTNDPLADGEVPLKTGVPTATADVFDEPLFDEPVPWRLY